MSNHESKILQLPGQKPSRRIRVQHIMDVFSSWSKGDVQAAASTVHSINMAQIRNLRDLIKGNLRLVGITSDTYQTTNEIDPNDLEDRVGMTQNSGDGTTFVSTEVVKDNRGSLKLVSLAFTTQLKEEVRKALGEPVRGEQASDIIHFPDPESQQEAA